MVPDPIDFCIAQDMVAVRADQKKVYPKYLFAVLRLPETQEQIEQMHVGTMIPHFKKGDFDKFLLPVLGRKAQEFIGDLYFNFSTKIELNQQINHTLESMVQSLFKSWFVAFDPVVAKGEGRQPHGMNAATASLFPSEFVETSNEDFAEIPKGWKLGKFGDVSENIRRGISPKDVEPDLPYIGLEHMPRKSIALSEWGRAGDTISNKFEFKKGEILFGKLRPYFHKVGVAPVDGVCSTDVLVVSPKESLNFGLVLGHVSSVEFVNYADSASEGTKMPRTNWETMARFPVVLPDEKLSEIFTRKIEPMIARIRANINETRVLVSIRDSLLPKLLSGEIRSKAI